MAGTKTLHLPNSAMPGLPRTALPTQARSEVMAENRQLVEEFYHVSGKLTYYERELRQVDEHLRIVMAKPETTVDGLKPGYYHIVRLRPGHMAYIKPVENPDGTWRDLDSYVFELVAEDDMWNDSLQRDKRRAQHRAQEAQQRQRDREAADRVAEFNDRLKHATNTQILVPRSI